MELKHVYDAVVIGAGSAGLAAATALCACGRNDVLVVEREAYAGGVLPQCVHDGFGLHVHGVSLTGPEYAERWTRSALQSGAHIALESTILGVCHCKEDGLFELDAVGVALGGHVTLRAHSVVCATGCTERTRGSMQIPGGRPAGVLTAGCAQYMVNVANQMPGDKVVVLGSGDIGLIMARRMKLEGADVRLVLGQEATGLVRNHIRCIRDFDIPIKYGWGLVSVHGFGQLQGVTVAPLLDDGGFDMQRKRYVRCNVLLIACGLIPEREVFRGLVDDAGNPQVDGLFVCGNAHVPHDLVDQVTQEGLRAGRDAACYVAEKLEVACSGLPSKLEAMMALRIREQKGRLSDLSSLADVQGTCVVCTECPSGCVMGVDAAGRIVGAQCARGRAFAANELARPMRLFTGTVKAVRSDGSTALLPVRTAVAIDKDAQVSVGAATAKVTAKAPLSLGDVVCQDVAGTGVALIACASCADVPGNEGGVYE